jgi:transitional endoplasmic reticulum ATPase
VCTCKSKCPTCSKPLPVDTSEAKKQAEAAEAKHEVTKNKMAMPTVDIPEHLKDNVLLKVVKHQIAILHADMENESDERPKSAKTKVDGGGRGVADVLRQRRMVAAMRALQAKNLRAAV